MRPDRAAAYALARFEGRKLLVHPAALAAIPLTAVLIVAQSNNADDDFLSYKTLVGSGLLPVAMCVMLASGYAVSRSRRWGTDELLATMPLGPQYRTFAQLVALAVPVAISTAGLAAALIVIKPWHGLATPEVPPSYTGHRVRSVTPGVTGLLQGPALVAFAGALGIALARWIPHVLAVTTTAVLGAYLLLPAAWWWNWEWQRLLLPVTHDLRSSGWVDTAEGASTQVVIGSTPEALSWHAAYLAGWTVLLAGIALAHDRSRRYAVWVAAGSLVVVAACVFQVTAWEAGAT